MANKKNIGRKKKQSSNNKRQDSKKIESIGEFNADYKHIIITVSVIVVVFFSFYFLTIYITGKDKKSDNTSKTDLSTFTYTDTVAGRSFSMPENEYLVLYYDQSDSELASVFASLASNYRVDSEHYALYCVDMSNDINKSYISDNSNYSPDKASDLAISGPTLIHFQNGTVIEYIEGEDDITNYLE